MLWKQDGFSYFSEIHGVELVHTDNDGKSKAVCQFYYNRDDNKNVITNLDLIDRTVKKYLAGYEAGLIRLKDFKRISYPFIDVEIAPYWKVFLKGSKFIGILKALPTWNLNAQTGWSIPLDEVNRCVSVFYMNLNNSRFRAVEDYAQEKKHVLYFKCVDDSNCALLFNTRREAYDYVQGLFVFEEIFTNPNLIYLN